MKHEESPFSNAAPERDVPYTLEGAFDWLRSADSHEERAIGNREGDELPSQLESLSASAKDSGINLPTSFTVFMADKKLHKNLRSATGDYLRLTEAVLPFADGFLVRFMSDKQESEHWYLYLDPDGIDHCVVSSHEFYDADEMDYEPEDIEETDFEYCATSFEAYLCQYWIAHEVKFAENDKTDLPDIDPKILTQYTSA